MAFVVLGVQERTRGKQGKVNAGVKEDRMEEDGGKGVFVCLSVSVYLKTASRCVEV